MTENQDIHVIPAGALAVRDGAGTVDLAMGLPNAIEATMHLTPAEAIELCTDLMASAMRVAGTPKFVPSTTTAGALVPA